MLLLVVLLSIHQYLIIMLARLVIFLLINFGALAIGGMFTGQGVPSDWYQELNKAPWTPPGWVFGFAWSTIMICFSVYLAHLWPKVQDKKALILIFSIQWVLNVSWNPTFFYFHQMEVGLVVIISLLLTVLSIWYRYQQEAKQWSLLLLPYVLWLIVATSLNAYAVMYN